MKFHQVVLLIVAKNTIKKQLDINNSVATLKVILLQMIRISSSENNRLDLL